MPASENEDGAPGQDIAVMAESLYLVNLLLAPGVGFLLLLRLYFKHRATASVLARSHLLQSVSASIWAGVLLVIANVVIVMLGGYTSANTWTVAIVYFTICHSTLVLLGIFGLAKAMAGQEFIYPLVGRRIDE